MQPLDRVTEVVMAGLSRAVAELHDDVLSGYRRGLPVWAAWGNVEHSRLLRSLLSRALERGWGLAWRLTGEELLGLVGRRLAAAGGGEGVEGLAEEPAYITPRPLPLPGGWRPYSPFVTRATWEWLAEHEATLQRSLPRAYVEAYLRYRVPMLADRVERHMAEAYQRIGAGIAERGFGVREGMAALRREFPHLTRWRLENIARTEGATLYSVGHLARYRADAAVEGVRYDAVMDSRTTAICRGLDGRAWRLDDPELVSPPAHYQCRSVLAPILFDEADSVRWESGPLPEDARPLEGFGYIPGSLLPPNVTMLPMAA